MSVSGRTVGKWGMCGVSDWRQQNKAERDQETQQGSMASLFRAKRAQIYSVSFPRTVFLRLQGIPHQRRRRKKWGDERTTWSVVDVWGACIKYCVCWNGSDTHVWWAGIGQSTQDLGILWSFDCCWHTRAAGWDLVLLCLHRGSIIRSFSYHEFVSIQISLGGRIEQI